MTKTDGSHANMIIKLIDISKLYEIPSCFYSNSERQEAVNYSKFELIELFFS